MSTSSLYGNVGNVIVSANNLTTLYNATGGNVVTANVPDKDFTTLYTTQVQIEPTRAYGNSNVEAFLNAGFDAGGNIVQNINANGYIHANGNLTIEGTTSLGDVANVHILGGNLNYVLQTDGAGNLNWVAQAGTEGNSIPYTHFNVTATANNQQFTSTNLGSFANVNDMAVFKNGVNIEPSLYSKPSANVLQINILLNTGDTIDVLPSAAGGGSPGGNLTEVQYNGGASLSGNASFTFDQPNSLMTVGNISTDKITVANVQATKIVATGDVTLGDVSNVHIDGGTNGQFLTTDGLGTLYWGFIPLTEINANINNVHISGGTTGQVLSTDGSNNLSWTSFIANANFANTANIANTANTANTANNATTANVAITAGSATTAINVSASSQPNITSIGTQTSFTSTGIVDLTSASNVALGANSNIHITGGTGGQVLSTDGSGNLSWLTVLVGTPNYANFAGQVVDSTQSNITSLGTLTTLSVAGMTSIQEAKEKFVANSTGATGTIQFDVLTSAIILQTANASANFTLNIRGNSTTTFNSILSTNESASITYVNKNGATAYYANTFQIDGSNITPVWPFGAPSAGTPSGYDVYNFNILKTGSSTYVVFAVQGGYK
jgi:hypothetical protein